jgi:hypothetical protein
MKKLLIVLLLSGLAYGPLSAQVFTLGPKFGLSQANVKVFEGYEKDESKMGYHLGLFARINTPIIFIQPELLYTNTGGSFSDDSFNYDVDFDRLDVPLMIGFKFAGIFRLQAGPIASYMLNSDMSTNDPGISNLVPPKEDFTFGYPGWVRSGYRQFTGGFKIRRPFVRFSEGVFPGSYGSKAKSIDPLIGI